MGDKSAIEWTDATWNPVTGCSKVSPGCAHCYAETLALTRLAGKPGYPGLPWTPENAAANVTLQPARLDVPLGWKAPRRVFVNSMSDLFHELVPANYIQMVWAVMAFAKQHQFQVLTKRPERMRLILSDLGWAPGIRLMKTKHGEKERTWVLPWLAGSRDAIAEANPDRENPMADWIAPNVWVGTSIENDRWVGRADELRATPAAIRFLSCEPLLGPLPSLDLTGIDWVIAGGESGPDHRPLNLDWVRDLRDRCQEAGIAFLFKQVGGRTPKSGGRTLDGRTWDEYPA